MTTNERSLFAAVADATAGSVTLSSARGTWTGRSILDGAERLAAWLPASAPVVSVSADIVGTAVTALAADLAGVPVIHADPSMASFPAGTLVRDTRPSEPGDYADDALGIHGRPSSAAVDLGGVPGRSQIFLTSGSTGDPVGVVRGVPAVLADAEAVGSRLRYAAGRRIVVGAPVFHLYGYNYGLIAALLAGVPVHFCGPRAIPSQLARAVSGLGAETLIGHPMQYRLVAKASAAGHAVLPAGLAQAVSAGAPLPVGAAAGILAQHRQLTLLNCYGSSEAGAVTLSPVHGAEAPGDVGVPLPGVAVRAETGELRLRTPSLATGYLTPQGLTPLPLRDGWYSTGDLATIEGDRLRLRGRAANVINVGGKKVSPEQVEQVLSEHPAVADVDVYGESDDARGNVPVADVVLRERVSKPELLDWCRARLAPFMVPRRIEIHDELPRSPTGKRLSSARVD